MSVAATYAVSLNGLEGSLVTVEASLSSQLPGIAIIGLPDTSLTEAKQRIRVACQNSAMKLSNRFITLNLSPAELPKNGSAFDLAMALAALAASGEVRVSSVRSVLHIGELGLDGQVRRTRGILSMVQVAQREGIKTVIVPSEAVAEAQLVGGVEVVGVGSLREAVCWHRGEVLPQQSERPSLATEAPALSRKRHAEANPSSSQQFMLNEPDMNEIIGQSEAVRALTIAAVGGHHTSLVGPPGTGKTMLASRLATILPDLTDHDALETTSIASIAGVGEIRGLIRRPPFEAPHHTVTSAAMVGTGSRVVNPGAITRATNGILFLDEAPEFGRAVLDCLRQPLESGTVSIQRARLSVSLPARFILVLASNPCGCGESGTADARCTCDGGARRRYSARISGPLRDRLDLRLNIHRSSASLYADHTPANLPTSKELREQVTAARSRTSARLKKTPWKLNRDVPGSWLRHPDNRPSRFASAALDDAFAKGMISMRAYDRALRVAWSIADLEGTDVLERTHIARALAYREGRAM
jgi:magnesium chelatase family protein